MSAVLYARSNGCEQVAQLLQRFSIREFNELPQVNLRATATDFVRLTPHEQKFLQDVFCAVQQGVVFPPPPIVPSLAPAKKTVPPVAPRPVTPPHVAATATTATTNAKTATTHATTTSPSKAADASSVPRKAEVSKADEDRLLKEAALKIEQERIKRLQQAALAPVLHQHTKANTGIWCYQSGFFPRTISEDINLEVDKAWLKYLFENGPSSISLTEKGLGLSTIDFQQRMLTIQILEEQSPLIRRANELSDIRWSYSSSLSPNRQFSKETTIIIETAYINSICFGDSPGFKFKDATLGPLQGNFTTMKLETTMDGRAYTLHRQ